MNRTVFLLAIAVAAIGASAADAQCFYTSYYQPATVYYAPAPVTTVYYAPAPAAVYYAAPVTTYYAPRVAYYAPVAYPVRRAYYAYYPW